MNRAIIAIRQRGILRAAYWAWFGYLKPNRFILYKHDLSERSSIPSADFIIKKLTLQELKNLRMANQRLPEEFFIDEMKTAKHCWIAFINGKPVHISWAFIDGEPSRFFNLGEGEAETNYSYTLKEYRSRGIDQAVQKEIIYWLKRKDIHTVYRACHASNVPVLRSSEKNFKRIGEITHWGIFYRPKWRQP